MAVIILFLISGWLFVMSTETMPFEQAIFFASSTIAIVLATHLWANPRDRSIEIHIKGRDDTELRLRYANGPRMNYRQREIYNIGKSVGRTENAIEQARPLE